VTRGFPRQEAGEGRVAVNAFASADHDVGEALQLTLEGLYPLIEVPLHDEQARPGIAQLVGDLLCLQPGVYHHRYRPRGGDGQVADAELGVVQEDHGHAVALGDAVVVDEGGGRPPHQFVQVSARVPLAQGGEDEDLLVGVFL